MKNLCDLNASELKEFVDSFDIILSDNDGVLIKSMATAIPGSPECFRFLKEKLGKPIKLVSNNSSMSRRHWLALLQKNGFDVNYDELVNPGTAILDHLKEVNFDKEIFLVGFECTRVEAKEAGLKITEKLPGQIEEKLDVFVKMLKDDPEIGAVVFDWNLNMNYLTLLKASIYLNRPEVLFFIGGTDKRLIFGNTNVLGPGYFQDILSNYTKRTPICYGKPSADLNEYLKKKFQIADNKRVLFIGDSPAQDIAFAHRCGYKTLLVLTGLAREHHLDALQGEEKPDYYIESLGCLEKLIKEKLFN